MSCAKVLRALALPVALSLGVSALGACGGAPLDRTPPPSPADYGPDSDGETASERLIRNATRTTYRVYVANESSDNVSRVAFTPGEGLAVEDTIPVGIMPGDIDGAHGITVSPDGDHWYVTIAHGTPDGYLWKFTTGTDSLVSRTELGRFPATVGITSGGGMLFVVNFNLHGDREPSDVSVVHGPSMTELSRITTCVTPHGSRVDETDTKHYSACSGSDQVVEIDVATLEVTKRFSVTPGSEGPLPLSDQGAEPLDAGGGSGAEPPARCAPTWAEPATGVRAGRIVYVACNGNREVLAVSTRDWEVADRFETGAGPYNLEATADGRYLAATLKGEQAVAIFDLDRGGEEVARIETSEPVTHGVVASPDSRYLFVTNESIGATRGTLDVIDLRSMERVASVTLGHQSGGIDFWEIDRLVR